MTAISLHRDAARVFDPRTWGAARVVASLLWLATVAGIVTCVVLWSQLRFATPPVRFASAPVIAGEGVLSLAYSSVGWILATRRGRNPIGWMFLAIGLVTAAQMPVTQLVAAAHQVLRPIDTTTLLAAWLASSAHLPFVAALAITVFVIFPDGRPLSRRWLLPAVIAIVGTAIVAAASALSPQGLIWYPSLANPFALPEWLHPAHSLASAIGAVFIIGGLVLAALSIVVRYRRADEIGRAQLRWVVYAIVLIALTAAPFMAAMYAMGGVPGAIGDALLLAVVVAGSFLPIAAAVAITRYRLFEIDLIINRTLVYIPLLALLGGLFAAGITFSQRVFIAATGNTSDLAIVVTTLFVAAVETPVRRGLESLVDRHVKPTAKVPSAPTAATPSHDRADAPLGVRPFLEAAGYVPLPERAPEAPGAEGRDMVSLVEHLTRRIEELESRVRIDQDDAAVQEGASDRTASNPAPETADRPTEPGAPA